MHIISQKRIWEAQKKFPECASALEGWYRIVKKNYFGNFSELRWVFNSIDKVYGLYVFNIGGNKLRLIASIHFNLQRIYILEILPHKIYDHGKWKY